VPYSRYPLPSARRSGIFCSILRTQILDCSAWAYRRIFPWILVCYDTILFTHTTGNWNTASGNEALFSNTTSNDGTASGYRALDFNTTGFDNSAVGSYANIALGANGVHEVLSQARAGSDSNIG
jgi:hypothetical protein